MMLRHRVLLLPALLAAAATATATGQTESVQLRSNELLSDGAAAAAVQVAADATINLKIACFDADGYQRLGANVACTDIDECSTSTEATMQDCSGVSFRDEQVRELLRISITS